MTTGLRIAIDVLDQSLESLHRVAHFRMQLQRGVQPVALNPLRTLETSRVALGLSAIACTAAPTDPVGFQHGSLDPMLLRQENCAGQASEARANDGNIHIDIMRDRTIVRW